MTEPGASERPEAPRAQIYVNVFLAGRDREPQMFTAGRVALTPERMQLLAQLVEPDRWEKSVPSEPTDWGTVEAAVTDFLGVD